jgi:hypothetical protein
MLSDENMPCMLSLVLQSVIYAECRYNTKCHFPECCYAECCYAECCYAECRRVDEVGYTWLKICNCINKTMFVLSLATPEDAAKNNLCSTSLPL